MSKIDLGKLTESETKELLIEVLDILTFDVIRDTICGWLDDADLCHELEMAVNERAEEIEAEEAEAQAANEPEKDD